MVTWSTDLVTWPTQLVTWSTHLMAWFTWLVTRSTHIVTWSMHTNGRIGNDVYPAKARKQAPCCWPQRQRSKEDLLHFYKPLKWNRLIVTLKDTPLSTLCLEYSPQITQGNDSNLYSTFHSCNSIQHLIQFGAMATWGPIGLGPRNGRVGRCGNEASATQEIHILSLTIGYSRWSKMQMCELWRPSLLA